MLTKMLYIIIYIYSLFHLLKHLLSAYNMPNTVGGAVDKKKKKHENMPLGLKEFSV